MLGSGYKTRDERVKAMLEGAMKVVAKHEAYKPSQKLKSSKTKPGIEPTSSNLDSTTSSTISSVTLTDSFDNSLPTQEKINKLKLKYLKPKNNQGDANAGPLSKDKEAKGGIVKGSGGGGGDNDEVEDYSEFTYSSGQSSSMPQQPMNSENENKTSEIEKQKSVSSQCPSSLKPISSVQESMTAKSISQHGSGSYSQKPKSYTPLRIDYMKPMDESFSSIRTELSGATNSKSKKLRSVVSPTESERQKLHESIKEVLSNPLVETSIRSSIGFDFELSPRKRHSKHKHHSSHKSSHFTTPEEKVLLKSEIQERTCDWILSTSESLSNGSVSGEWLKKSMTGKITGPQFESKSQAAKSSPNHVTSTSHKELIESVALPNPSPDFSKQGKKLSFGKKLNLNELQKSGTGAIPKKAKDVMKALEQSDTSASEQLPEDPSKSTNQELKSQPNPMLKHGHENDVFKNRRLSSWDKISFAGKINQGETLAMKLPLELKVPDGVSLRDLVLTQQKKQKDRSQRISQELRKNSLPEVYELNSLKKTKNSFGKKMNQEMDSIMQKIAAAPSVTSSVKSYEDDFVSESDKSKSASNAHSSQVSNAGKASKSKTPGGIKTDKQSKKALTGLVQHVMAANAEIFLQALETANALKKISKEKKKKSGRKIKKTSQKKKKVPQPKIYIKNLLMH